MTNVNRKPCMRWNKYAQTYPLIVFCACVFLFFVQTSRQNWIYLAPVTILGINSLLVFVFWTLRLNTPQADSKRALSVGYMAQIAGITGFAALFTLPVIILTAPQWFERFTDGISAVFWVLWVFAVVELIHNNLYKLMYGKYTLERIIVENRWSDFAEPYGGAIGRQIRKLQSNDARKKETCL